MAKLQRFIPQTPDPYLKQADQLGAVKFGHLNSLVDAINSTIYGDYLQLAGDGPMSTTLRALEDPEGNLAKLYLAIDKTAILGPLKIGDASSNVASAILQIDSTTQGVLFPRLTVVERDAIAAPAVGLLIYNADDLILNQWDGVEWTEVGGGGLGLLDDALMTSTLTAVVDKDNTESALLLSTERIGLSSDSTATTQTTAVIQATDTNSGIAIVPNGTGAITAQVPDGTAVGGNARGDYAVDLQTSRTSADEVAGKEYTTISGGQNNKASSFPHASVIGGINNNSSGRYSVTGGSGNSANSQASVAIGWGNTSGYGGTSFGRNNTATSTYGVVSGGQSNTASTGTHATVVGGQSNVSSGQFSVSGGDLSTASGLGSVALGIRLGATGSTASSTGTVAMGVGTISSGYASVAMGRNVNVSGSQGVGIGNNLSVTGLEAVCFGSGNTVSSDNSTISGGENNTIAAGANHQFIGGGGDNQILGTNATMDYNVIVGGSGNTAESGNNHRYMFIGGGSSNVVSEEWAVVTGGRNNSATAKDSTVVGGQGNTSSGQYSVSGGNNSTASGQESISFGGYSTASGGFTIAMGNANQASGGKSVVLGADSRATQTGSVAIGSVVFSDAEYAFVTGNRTIGYLYGQNTSANGRFQGNGDAQVSKLIARKQDTLTTGGTTVLSLDGSGTTNLIIPSGSNRAWNVKVETIATVTGITGTVDGVSVGDSIMQDDTLLFTKVAGVSSVVGVSNTNLIASDSLATAGLSYAAGASQELAITFTAPTFTGGGSVTVRAVSKVSLVEVAW
jgi:hypothetical protein